MAGQGYFLKKFINFIGNFHTQPAPADIPGPCQIDFARLPPADLKSHRQRPFQPDICSSFFAVKAFPDHFFSPLDRNMPLFETGTGKVPVLSVTAAAA
jgi:hypothetical protein